MIDSVVNTKSDYIAKLGKEPNSNGLELDKAINNVANTKTTKAEEVQSQANAVNSKDMVENVTITAKEKAEKLALEKEKKAKDEKEQEEIIAQAKEMSVDLSKLTRNFGLSFSVNDDIDRTVVTVSDNKTEEVIRQIPSEDFVKLMTRIRQNREDMGVAQDAPIMPNEVNGFLMDSEV